MGRRIELQVGQIKVGEHEQRFELDEEQLSELVGSIRRLGLIEPLVVVKRGNEFMLVAGHRRLAACKRAGLDKVPVDVIEGDESQAAEITFAENFFRADLTPVELACAIAKEYESGRMSIEQIAAGFRRSKDWVARQIAITHWPEDCLQAIHSGGLSVGAVANLAQISEDTYRQYLIGQACENGATARATAAWLQAWRACKPPEEAVQAEPLEGERPVVPMCPQAPCISCNSVKRVDELCHVPVCVSCLERIRRAE